jgi:hypothetical protein
LSRFALWACLHGVRLVEEITTMARITDPQELLTLAIAHMVRGTHAPHSYSAHVPGQGYVNRGGPPFDRADYLRQLQHAAESERDNLGFAPGYAGYSAENQPARGVLFADWNTFPSSVGDALERLGFECEWSDEWTICDDCQQAVRTSPDSYDYQPMYAYVNDEWNGTLDTTDGCTCLCVDCLQEWAEGKRAEELEALEESEESDAL